ncbi:MAG: helix-turn-helix transcriptional regulator [Paraclostridium sp.]
MKVKEYRIKNGYTQEQMADMLGIKQQSYCRKENGQRGFTVEELFILEAVLKASISDLFKDKKEEAENKVGGYKL